MKFISKAVFILAAIVFAMNIQTSAQNGAKNPISTINPVSPTTAELLKYVDFNVSSSTGVPDITIPLFEVKGKQLSLPISISYNASGIKVNQQAGNIGLAWSLNAGGMVSCAIRGRRDDQTYWQSVPAAVNNGFDPAADPADFNMAKSISNKAIDGAPDLYSYSFGNYSGKFLNIIGKTPAITMIPKKPLDIKPYATIPSSPHSNFKITAEDGTQYFFEKLETTTIRTSYGISQAGFTNYLTKIRSADGTDEINFSYDTTYYEDLPALSESFTYLTSACYWGTEVTSGSQPQERFTSSSRIRGVQLKRITFSEGSVDFLISYNRLDAFGGTAVKNPKIDRIILKNLAGVELKTISFIYSYYNASSTSLYAKRLKLDRVDICPQSNLCGNAQYTNSYKFTYNAIALPPLNSFAQDHWGYFNNANTNHTFLPTYPINLTPVTCYSKSPFCPCTPPNVGNSFSGANKNSSPDYVKAGILEKIEYPTGGSVQFAFETNQTAPLIYYTPSTKTVYSSVVNKVSNNDINQTVNSLPTDFLPTGDANIGVGVCATVTLNWGYPAGTPPTDITKYRPTAELWKATVDGDLLGLVASYTSFAANTNTTYNLTLPAGTAFILKVTAKLKGSTVNGQLKFSVPVTNVTPYYVGGLRLQQKTVYDPVANTSSITKYAYSAATFKNPVYTQLSYQFPGPIESLCGEVCQGTGGNGSSPDYYDVKKYTTLIANNGGIDNEVNYEEVTTIYGATGENGKTITKFTPYNNDYFWRKGSFDTRQEFNASGKLLRKVVNHYTVHSASSEIHHGLEVSATSEHPCLSSQPLNFGMYTKYASYKPTFNPTEWFYMDTTTTYDYDTQTANAKKNKTVFVYLNATHMQLNQQYTTNSVGKNVVKFFRYPIDYSYNGTLSGSALVMKEMNNKHIYNQPVEEIDLLVGGSPVTTLQTTAVVHTYKLNNLQVVKDADYRLKLNTSTGINAQAISNYTYASIPSGQLVYDGRMEFENQYKVYDLFQNLVELKQQDQTYAFRCPVNGDVWAKTKNAFVYQTYYTSFEHGNIANDFTNWSYNNASILTDATPAPLRGTFNGDKCYRFASTSDFIATRSGVDYGLRYKISFWGKNGSVTVTGEASAFSPAAFNIPLRTGPTRMGWTYYEGYFNNATSIRLSGTGLIDELRMHPASAQMETFVYKQGIGLWSKCNENNQNTFWDYDEFQRLRLTTDQDGYILNKNEYKYLQPQN
jgi:hypothetical protein